MILYSKKNQAIVLQVKNFQFFTFNTLKKMSSVLTPASVERMPSHYCVLNYVMETRKYTLGTY